jgi:hypothetical protein
MSAATSTPTPAPGATPRWGRGGASLVPRIGDEFQCSAVQQGTVQASCCFRLPGGFDPRQIHPRLPAPGRRVTAPAQAGAAGFTDVGASGYPLACGLSPSGNRPRQTSTGRLLSGPLAAPEIRDHLRVSRQAAPASSSLVPDQARQQKCGLPALLQDRIPVLLAGFGPRQIECRLSVRGQARSRPPGQARLDLPASGPPGPRACARCVRAALTPLPCGVAPSGNRTLRPSTEGSRAGSSGSANVLTPG